MTHSAKTEWRHGYVRANQFVEQSIDERTQPRKCLIEAVEIHTGLIHACERSWAILERLGLLHGLS